MRDQQARFARMVDSLQRAGAARAGSSGGDPCTLVSRAEAEQLLGALRHDPYRVDGSGDPAPGGSACRYEAETGRHLVVDVTFEGAAIGMRAIGLGVQIASPVFGTDSAQLASLQGRWDEFHVLPGHLMARQGDAMVDVGYAGSRAGLGGAARVADVALGRLSAPLPYDGAAAARGAPGPLVTPRDPCTLVSRADVEAILGALASDPVSNGTEHCTYTLSAPRGLGGQAVQLTVQWRDGFAALEGARSTAAIVQRQVGGGALGGMKDSGFAGFMQQVQGVMRSQGIGVQMSDSGSGLENDSAVAGPWDEASLIAGLGFSAVKQDVLISVDLRTIPYDQARALIAKAMQRL
jgi:hypothetical protein